MDHDHLPALTALLYAAPAIVLALSALEWAAGRGWPAAAGLRHRLAAAPAGARVTATLMVLAGAIHLGLVPGHLAQPVYAVSFVAAGIALPTLALALLADARWLRPAALLLAGVVLAYGLTRVAGLESVDALGVATGVVELAALGLLIDLAGRRRPRSSPARLAP